ncbi:MAG: hypothetical protein QXE05_01415 [Nitrososphaeria archaeon]
MPLELTDFIQMELDDQLSKRLSELGVGFYTKKEKTLKGIRFDNYAYSKKREVFLIWELEMENDEKSCIQNVEKVQRILRFKWHPYVHMFHIFSPSCEVYKQSCERVANKLKKKYEIRFTYKQFVINIPYDEFRQMEEAFERKPKQAEQRYGRRLRMHISKIVKQSIELFTGRR